MKKLNNNTDNSLNMKRKKRINEAAELFSQLSPEVKEAVIELVKNIVAQNKKG